jgi:hypothetical protein
MLWFTQEVLRRIPGAWTFARRSSLATRTSPSSSSRPHAGTYGRAGGARSWWTPSSRPSPAPSSSTPSATPPSPAPEPASRSSRGRRCVASTSPPVPVRSGPRPARPREPSSPASTTPLDPSPRTRSMPTSPRRSFQRCHHPRRRGRARPRRDGGLHAGSVGGARGSRRPPRWRRLASDRLLLQHGRRTGDPRRLPEAPRQPSDCWVGSCALEAAICTDARTREFTYLPW